MISAFILIGVVIYFYRKRRGQPILILFLCFMYTPVVFQLMPSPFSAMTASSLLVGITWRYIDHERLSLLVLSYIDWLVGYESDISSDSTTSQ